MKFYVLQEIIVEVVVCYGEAFVGIMLSSWLAWRKTYNKVYNKCRIKLDWTFSYGQTIITATQLSCRKSLLALSSISW